ncbi:MAG: undecaprenyl/decaprenyl-phosphate alpha-N-acetylglucosaminyl 1-phosphate transferase [Phycisphaerales bacterium]|nr:undecaprenyl/decaprenyl-phosphate alpha-N-acetylglucosaminyl 1-phosphate transferase [Phycisphaerales bacterium]
MAKLVCIAVIGSFMMSVLLTWIVRRWALRTGFVDRPGGHKSHGTPIALGGGIAIFISATLPLIAGSLIARWIDPANLPTWVPEFIQPHLQGMGSKLVTLLSIFAGALVLHVLGLIDDRKPLGPGIKLVIQTLVALAIVGLCKIRAIEAMGPIISITATVFWIVFIINAFNFLDNMDGLSAGVAAIAACIFACSATQTGQIFVPIMAWVLVGTLLGFLMFNFAPASVFMGDAGSMVVGYLLAILTILTTFYDPEQGLAPVGVLVPLIVLAVPLYDVISVTIHRIRAGESPFRGDQRHFSHRLVRRGMSVRAAVCTIYLATGATGISAIIVPRVDWSFATLLFAQCCFVVLMIAILEHAPATATPKTDKRESQE